LEAREGRLSREGRIVPLAPKAFHTLLVFVESAGHLVEKDDLIKQVWPDTFVEESNLAQHIFAIRRALAEDPAQGEYIETVPKRGYRFLAPVCRLEPAGPEDTDAQAAWVWRPRVQSAMVAGIFLALLALLTWQVFLPRPQPASPRIALAVLPFENLTGDPDKEYIGDGLTEELITRLSSFPSDRLAVIARTSAMKYKNTSAGARQIGWELGVQYLLEGSIREERGQARITAQLIRVQDQTHLWAETFTRDAAQILPLQEEVSEAIVRQIQSRLAPREAPVGRGTAPTSNREAQEAYLKGRFFLSKRTREGLERALDYLTRATSTAPDFAAAHAGLAEAYILLGQYNYRRPGEAYPRARAEADRALKIDDALSEGHLARAVVAACYEWDWGSAERGYQQAIALNPGYATAHQWYGEFLAILGRFEEARAAFLRARELDPLSPIITVMAGSPEYFSGNYDAAIAQFRRAFEIEPDFVPAYLNLALAYSQKGMHAEAIAAAQRALQATNGQVGKATLAYAYAQAGRKGDARAILVELRELSKKEYVPPLDLAAVLTALGDKDGAFEQLEAAFRDRDEYVVVLQVEPMFAPLRSDPRFQGLLRRIGLPAR
jgi:TolB-like protein/DNA-binding winged helix-turn-helix (wHTH) protein/Flp pilus assembly protein TadD